MKIHEDSGLADLGRICRVKVVQHLETEGAGLVARLDEVEQHFGHVLIGAETAHAVVGTRIRINLFHFFKERVRLFCLFHRSPGVCLGCFI